MLCQDSCCPRPRENPALRSRLPGRRLSWTDVICACAVLRGLSACVCVSEVVYCVHVGCGLCVCTCGVVCVEKPEESSGSSGSMCGACRAWDRYASEVPR